MPLSWRPPNREERQLAALWAVTAVSTVLLRPFWLALAPLLPPCPFRALTGVPCPSCGTTHAAVALLHGDLAAALGANPGASLAALLFLLGGLAAPLWIALGGCAPDRPLRLPPWARLGLVLALVVNWAWVILGSR